MTYARIITIGLVLLLAASVLAVNPRDMKFSELGFQPEEPARFTTDNGLTVYFLEYHELPLVTMTVYFRGGLIYDPPDRAGLTELTTQLLRTGGAGDRSPDSVDIDLDFVGAGIRSEAQNDYIVVSLNALKKDAALTFGILADMLIRPQFDSGKVALEASNLKDRIRRQNDSPWDISRRVFYQTVYAGHPYGQYATLASIDNITRADIQDQHQRFFTPDNCILAIAGDLTPDEARVMVDEHFGAWKASGQTIDPPQRAVQQFTPGVYYAAKDMNQANIRLGHLGLTSDNPDRFAMEVTNFVLGAGGFTSRLVGQVRTTAGLAYTVGSYQSDRPYGGCLFGYCLTRADAMGQAVTMMLDIIRDVRENGITAEEVALAKESIINSYVFEYDLPGELVAARAFLELRGFPPDQLEKNLDAYKAVTLEDCNRVARQYLQPDNMVIVVTGTKDLFDKPLETLGNVTTVSMEIK